MTTGTTGDSGNASTMAYFGGGLMDSLDSGYCNNAGGLFFLVLNYFDTPHHLNDDYYDFFRFRDNPL